MSLAESAFRTAIAAHVWWYRTTRGRLAGKGLLLLTTTGRKTGKERVSPLVRVDHGDDYLVAASMGGAPQHPGWYFNLVENPVVTVQVGATVEQRAARVTSGEERDRLFQKFVDRDRRFAGYQERTDRTIPVVVLQPRTQQSGIR